MARRPRRNHSGEFKARVALAAIRGDKTLSELAEHFEVHPHQVTEWKKHCLSVLFDTARAALAPGGRVVTLDGCYVTGQSRIAKFFLAHDRGQFVRTQDGYEKLAKRVFGRVKTHILTDLMRIPYTHIILECS